MMRSRTTFIGLVTALVCVASPARASETTTFSYDAQGRLVAIFRTGTVNDGQQTAISYDAASNRVNYTTSGVVGPPVISIANALVTEGGNLVFTVTRSGSTSGAVSASWATSAGTATSGGDFAAGSGTVSFAAGQTSATITVATIDDNAVESSETMTVTLSSPSGGATIGTATATGTINDNDTAPANLVIGNASVTEGGTLAFTVTRSGNTANAVTVIYATAGGTATSGSDFTAASGTLSFAANETSKTVNVTTIDDSTTESTETMTVGLSGASSGATIVTATGTGSIVDNDAVWTAGLTAGLYQFCYFGTCQTFYQGYAVSTATGSMNNTSFNGYTITNLYTGFGSVTFSLSGSAAAPNSGWTSITVPGGVGTLQRSAATYSVNGTVATWTWSSSAQVNSGTVTIQ